MLRKLKDSLMRFKKYLESEGAELEKMFSKYKKTLFSQRSYAKLHWSFISSNKFVFVKVMNSNI